MMPYRGGAQGQSSGLRPAAAPGPYQTSPGA